jgi:hypothetical protein
MHCWLEPQFDIMFTELLSYVKRLAPIRFCASPPQKWTKEQIIESDPYYVIPSLPALVTVCLQARESTKRNEAAQRFAVDSLLHAAFVTGGPGLRFE